MRRCRCPWYQSIHLAKWRTERLKTVQLGTAKPSTHHPDIHLKGYNPHSIRRMTLSKTIPESCIRANEHQFALPGAWTTKGLNTCIPRINLRWLDYKKTGIFRVSFLLRDSPHGKQPERGVMQEERNHTPSDSFPTHPYILNQRTTVHTLQFPSFGKRMKFAVFVAEMR